MRGPQHPRALRARGHSRPCGSVARCVGGPIRAEVRLYSLRSFWGLVGLGCDAWPRGARRVWLWDLCHV
jgi:hypothetical protein